MHDKIDTLFPVILTLIIEKSIYMIVLEEGFIDFK